MRESVRATNGPILMLLLVVAAAAASADVPELVGHWQVDVRAVVGSEGVQRLQGDQSAEFLPDGTLTWTDNLGKEAPGLWSIGFSEESDAAPKLLVTRQRDNHPSTTQYYVLFRMGEEWIVTEDLIEWQILSVWRRLE